MVDVSRESRWFDHWKRRGEGAFFPASPAASDLQLGTETRFGMGTWLLTPVRAKTSRGTSRRPLYPSHPEGRETTSLNTQKRCHVFVRKR